ncbi:MAG: hypothetical protein WB052_05060, partial [Pseudolabrys sp.]
MRLRRLEPDELRREFCRTIPPGRHTGRIRSCSPRKSSYLSKALGLTVPTPLLGRADEVIEWMAQCPLLALSGHTELQRTCPLSGVKRTCPFALHMS